MPNRWRCFLLRRLHVKRSKLSYDEWKCIESKELYGKEIDSNLIKGYVGLLHIKKVSEVQTWYFNGENIIVCDDGMTWLTILPKDEHYCITTVFDKKGEIIVWYIDIIAEQGVDTDGIPYFLDLYLDVIVYPDGMILLDDEDELEEAFSLGDISQSQYDLAIRTSYELQCGLLGNIERFKSYTMKCYSYATDKHKIDK